MAKKVTKTRPIPALCGEVSMANVKDARWVDDPQAESVMKSRKIPWRVMRVRMADIDFDASRANRGRIDEKLSDERVTEYGLSMLDGDAFPRPVFNEMANGRYYILSGNHRGRGAREAEFAEIEAYIVKIDDALLLDLVPMLFNIRHGINVPTEAKYEQARYMVTTYKVDKKQAAKDYRISYDAFCSYLRGLEAVDRLADYGIDGAKLPRAVQIKLNTVNNEHTFTACGQLLTRFKLDTDRALNLIEEARDAPNELEALQIVARINDQLVQERRGDRQVHTPVPNRDKLLRQMNGLINMLTRHKTAKACQITNPTDLRAVNDKVKTIVDRAVALFGYPGANAAPAPAENQRPETTSSRQAGPVPSGRREAPRGRRTTHV